MAGKDVVAYGSCDLFRDIDEGFIQQLSQLLATSPRALNDQEVKCLQFRETTAHYAGDYVHYYKAIAYAAALGNVLRDVEAAVPVTLQAEDMLQAYMTAWYQVDRYYRKFYTHIDQVGQPELLQALPQAVEEAYIHRYVERLSMTWGQVIKGKGGYALLPGMKQTDFYSWYVKPKKDMVAVIISDAFRYECGQELYERMQDDPNMTPKLEGMMANVPTYTQLGMASLLPHGELSIHGKNGFVSSDGQSTVGSAKREQLLQRAEKASKVMALDDILQLSRADLRQALKDVRVLYVYHNAVDATGDKRETEDMVFAAVSRGIGEILRCIKKLAVDKSMTHFLVTADHGFLYRRSDIPVYTKVSIQKQDDDLCRNKRFILSSQPLVADGIISWPLSHLAQEGYVQIPLSCDIFSLPGGGQHFVHGGVTLQELFVPVISMKYTKEKVDTAKVGVSWYSPQTRLTGLHNYVKFIQEEAVTDTKLPRTVTVVVEDTTGQALSNKVNIVANRTAANGADRIYTEKLILPERQYTNFPACLIIRDADDGDVLAQYDVVLDVFVKPWTLL